MARNPEFLPGQKSACGKFHQIGTEKRANRRSEILLHISGKATYQASRITSEFRVTRQQSLRLRTALVEFADRMAAILRRSP